MTKWCRGFSEGRTDVHDEQRNGRPSLISDDLLQEIEGAVRANRRVTIRELHHIIPEDHNSCSCDRKIRVQNIVRTLLHKMLMDDHKTKRTGSALKFLTRYAQEGDEFLDSIVTGDETWGFHHTPESKQQSLRCKKKSWRGSRGRRQTSLTRGCRSWFQDLINVWTMPATMLENKVTYRQFIHIFVF